MSASGRSHRDRKTVTAVPCGPWEPRSIRQSMKSLRGLAGRLFELAVPAVMSFTSPRAWAFSLFGIQQYLDRFPGDRSAQRQRDALADKLLNIYRSHPHAGLELV